MTHRKLSVSFCTKSSLNNRVKILNTKINSIQQQSSSLISKQAEKIEAQEKMLREQAANLTEANKRILDLSQKYSDLVAEVRNKRCKSTFFLFIRIFEKYIRSRCYIDCKLSFMSVLYRTANQIINLRRSESFHYIFFICIISMHICMYTPNIILVLKFCWKMADWTYNIYSGNIIMQFHNTYLPYITYYCI